MENTTRRTTGETRYLLRQPGNGTRYEIYIIEDETLDYGHVVCLPEFNVSFSLGHSGFLHWNYVHEKLSRGRGDRGFNQTDASAITLMLAQALGRGACVHTDDFGRWVEEERQIHA